MLFPMGVAYLELYSHRCSFGELATSSQSLGSYCCEQELLVGRTPSWHDLSGTIASSEPWSKAEGIATSTQGTTDHWSVVHSLQPH